MYRHIMRLQLSRSESVGEEIPDASGGHCGYDKLKIYGVWFLYINIFL